MGLLRQMILFSESIDKFFSFTMERTRLINSSSTPLRAAFFIDLRSTSKFFELKSIINFSPFSSPTYCLSIKTLWSSLTSVFKIMSCFNPLAKILIFLSIKLLVSSSCNLSDRESSIFFVS